MLSAVVSISTVSTCSAIGGGEAGGGAGATTAASLFRPLFPFTGRGDGAADSVTIWVAPISPVATLRGRASPLGRRTMLVLGATLLLFCLRFCVDGLMGIVFWAGVGVAACIVTGEVMIAWLVPGIIWICPPWGTIWMVWAPWIWGTTWYWMLAAFVLVGRVGGWIVKRMGLVPEEPKPAGSWMIFPLADRKPRFLGGAGAMGAGLIGWRRRVVGWAGGVLAGAWAAGGPILLQVAARRAKGDGWESYKTDGNKAHWPVFCFSTYTCW